MAKKADKALKKLKEAVSDLEEQNGRLIETLERHHEEQAEALREIRDLLEQRLTARDAALDEPRQEDRPPDGEGPEGFEITDAALRRAEELGVDPSDVKGTGSGGRILVK